MKKAIAVFLVLSFFWFAAPPSAKADNVGTIVGGIIGGLAILGVISSVAGAQRDIAKIEADKRVRLEEIRSHTVLEVPCRLGQKGNASYNSTEGDARIESEIEGTPCSSPQPKVRTSYRPADGIPEEVRMKCAEFRSRTLYNFCIERELRKL